MNIIAINTSMTTLSGGGENFFAPDVFFVIILLRVNSGIRSLTEEYRGKFLFASDPFFIIRFFRVNFGIRSVAEVYSYEINNSIISQKHEFKIST
jgi:hypothetical protein